MRGLRTGPQESNGHRGQGPENDRKDVPVKTMNASGISESRMAGNPDACRLNPDESWT
ncbi:hypothetical protein G9463_16580 [Haloarcula sp. JP-Z28]|jgi:hypothetical protein|uniref:hypothetical protein n=1 Tax=Haloarcula sp. JP-Z28 TaxID=2716715 RepID=UPI0003213BC4|nr:hypothetical protein [Haloarcula sp. JP-Z28]NHN64904.1 hypothetical protein [Haloarcula sp. JP-Z28]